MDAFISIDDNDDDVTRGTPMVPVQGDVLLRQMCWLRLLRQFRLMCLHRLMCHLELMHLLKEMLPLEEIIKLWRSIQDQPVLVVPLVQPKNLVVLLRLSWPRNYHLLSKLWRLQEWPRMFLSLLPLLRRLLLRFIPLFIVTGEGTRTILSPPVMMQYKTLMRWSIYLYERIHL